LSDDDDKRRLTSRRFVQIFMAVVRFGGETVSTEVY